MEKFWVGIDVAKDHLDLAVEGADTVRRFENNAAGHQALLKHLGDAEVQRVVLEATGGYERPLVAALLVAELPVVVINPRQVRPRNPIQSHPKRQHFRGRCD